MDNKNIEKAMEHEGWLDKNFPEWRESAIENELLKGVSYIIAIQGANIISEGLVNSGNINNIHTYDETNIINTDYGQKYINIMNTVICIMPHIEWKSMPQNYKEDIVGKYGFIRCDMSENKKNHIINSFGIICERFSSYDKLITDENIYDLENNTEAIKDTEEEKIDLLHSIAEEIFELIK